MFEVINVLFKNSFVNRTYEPFMRIFLMKQKKIFRWINEENISKSIDKIISLFSIRFHNIIVLAMDKKSCDR
jgi:hypothetical protein